VLRISITNDSQDIRLTIEGWLIGPWVDELRTQSEWALSRSKSVILDLKKLWFVDARGLALLRELESRSVVQVNSSTFISQQVKGTTQ